MKIVTGADSSHAVSMANLITTIHWFERSADLIVYDLGLTEADIATLHERGVAFTLKAFDYAAYPAFFDIRVNAGCYAWKPAIIWEELRGATQPVVWMDAGNLVQRPLTHLRLELFRTGFYSEYSAGDVPRWTHPDMLRWLGLPPDWGRGLLNLNAATLGFNPKYASAMALAEAWVRAAHHKDCIGPEGAHYGNHRYDQALLTVLAYRLGVITEPSRPNAAEDGGPEFTLHNDVG